MKNYIREIIRTFAGGEYPSSVKADFRDWLIDNDHSRETDHELQALFDETSAEPQADFEQSLERMRLMTGIDSRLRLSRLRRRVRICAAAAAVVLLMAVGAAFYYAPMFTQPEMIQAYVPENSTLTVQLPDGSTAIINSRSTLIYPEQFRGRDRSVILMGEATFSVAKDPKHPFIVKSADLQVTALGTEFNVSAYPEEHNVYASLLTGKVKVEFDDMKKVSFLEPEQQLVYNRMTGEYSVRRVSSGDVTAWQRGDIVLRSLTPREIFNHIERRFGCRIAVNASKNFNERFTFTFGREASLKEVLDIIRTVMGNMDYRLDEQTCYITLH